jgi:hypothetical protein
MSKRSNIEIPPLGALERTSWGRIQYGNELDDVGIDAQFCASTNAKDFSLGAALHAKPEVCLERGSARLHSNGKGLAAESIT